MQYGIYGKNGKYCDSQVWANSADPDQTAPEEQPDQGLHCLPFCLNFFDVLLYGKSKLFWF